MTALQETMKEKTIAAAKTIAIKYAQMTNADVDYDEIFAYLERWYNVEFPSVLAKMNGQLAAGKEKVARKTQEKALLKAGIAALEAAAAKRRNTKETNP